MEPNDPCHRRRNGFTRLDLLILIALAVIAAVLLPLLARPKPHPPGQRCRNNFRQVGLAYRLWATDNNNKFPAHVSTADGGAKEWIEAGAVYMNFLVMSNELSTPKLLLCPQETDPKRVVATAFVSFVPTNAPWSTVPYTGNSNVSYFVGLDANETTPGDIVSGDDNFTVAGSRPQPGILLLRTNNAVVWSKDRHVNQGNVGLADGSVMGVSTPKLREVLAKTGMATNRLVLP